MATLRVSRKIPVYQRDPVAPDDDNAQVMSITQAEKELGVNRTTLYRWLADGFIIGTQLTPQGPWHLRVDDELRAKIVPDVPEGWLSLQAAAKALGVARQTVLHKVQRGELQAVHVHQGRRRGLRIKVEQPGTGLFATP
ncbi:MAG TPA: hypothetical protein VG034_20100 [Acidimicrobiia bacterium]|nr:hypothetical protein [Acidimicrobiia bacterium]